MLYCSRLLDDMVTESGPSARESLHLLLELLTPIAKSWPSEYCLEANRLAIQVHGGYGYTRDYPVERLYRDNLQFSEAVINGDRRKGAVQ